MQTDIHAVLLGNARTSAEGIQLVVPQSAKMRELLICYRCSQMPTALPLNLYRV